MLEFQVNMLEFQVNIQRYKWKWIVSCDHVRVLEECRAVQINRGVSVK